MRIIVSLSLLVAGIASFVWGVAQAAGVVTGRGFGPIFIGILLTMIGVVLVRRLSGPEFDRSTSSPTSAGGHSLTHRYARPPSSGATAQPTMDQPGSRRRARPVVTTLVAILVLSGSLVVFGALSSDPPNVAQHVLDSCHDALRESEGPGAPLGQATTYESVGGSVQEVGFETAQGWTWTCTYDTETGTAAAGAVDRD